MGKPYALGANNRPSFLASLKLKSHPVTWLILTYYLTKTYDKRPPEHIIQQCSRRFLSAPNQFIRMAKNCSEVVRLSSA